MAMKQYFKYFTVWFIILGIAFAAFILTRLGKETVVRTNDQAPAERVYDYADVLTDAEEDALREYIAECEEEAKIDIIVMTINEDVESQGEWESVMEAKADNFYDDNNYGYDKPRGDGTLLLDNYYEGQMGTVTSTCGAVYEAFGYYENEAVLDAVYQYIDNAPYHAYRAFVSKSTSLMLAENPSLVSPESGFMLVIFSIICPIIVALIFVVVKLNPRKAKDTTQPNTYVPESKARMNISTDNFLRKNTVTTRIDTSSSSGGSRSSGGGGRGGSRTSRSGTRHGGGSRRR